MPGNDREVLLIIALSARALAQSARRARYTPIAIDAFGDIDTREICATLTVAPEASQGFADVDLDAIVLPLVKAFELSGIVYGSGFDDCPEQLRRLALHAPLLGASPAAIAAAKDPVRFARLCVAAGLRHPEIALFRPPDAETWLLKRAGGCGGWHIRHGWTQAAPGDYWQRRVEGQAISLLFTRDKYALVPLAWSEQWTDPIDSAPYRYGGAAGPLERKNRPQILAGLTRLTGALGLHGLASADFLEDDDGLWLLEINPRPGATLDVFDDDTDPLLLRHLSAIRSRAAETFSSRRTKASAVVYARRSLVAPDETWPGFASDLSAPGTTIPPQAPLCTVHAVGETVAEAKTLLAERVRRIYEFAEGATG